MQEKWAEVLLHCQKHERDIICEPTVKEDARHAVEAVNNTAEAGWCWVLCLPVVMVAIAHSYELLQACSWCVMLHPSGNTAFASLLSTLESWLAWLSLFQSRIGGPLSSRDAQIAVMRCNHIYMHSIVGSV